jgi:uncharacterized protein YlxP (DUF503 family)
VCRVELGIEDNDSLKGKRSVVRKIIDRTRNNYNLAMAEVDDLDSLGSAVLAFAVVGNDRRYLQSKIDKILEFIESLGLAPIVDSQFEIENY